MQYTMPRATPICPGARFLRQNCYGACTLTNHDDDDDDDDDDVEDDDNDDNADDE